MPNHICPGHLHEQLVHRGMGQNARRLPRTQNANTQKSTLMCITQESK